MGFRNVFKLSKARLGSDIETYQTPDGEILCWDIFFRSDRPDKPPKIVKLGVPKETDLNLWRKRLQEIITDPNQHICEESQTDEGKSQTSQVGRSKARTVEDLQER